MAFDEFMKRMVDLWMEYLPLWLVAIVCILMLSLFFATQSLLPETENPLPGAENEMEWISANCTETGTHLFEGNTQTIYICPGHDLRIR